MLKNNFKFLAKPKHLWSNDSKFKKTRIRFSVEKGPSTSKLNMHSFDSVSAAQMHDIDSYFMLYEK